MVESYGRGRGGGWKKSGGGGHNKEVAISKTLAFILRHGAAKVGLEMRPDGYVLAEELLKTKEISSNTLFL